MLSFMTSFMTYNEMGRTCGRDQSAIMMWPCACARMCRAYIRQLAHSKDYFFSNTNCNHHHHHCCKESVTTVVLSHDLKNLLCPQRRQCSAHIIINVTRPGLTSANPVADSSCHLARPCQDAQSSAAALRWLEHQRPYKQRVTQVRCVTGFDIY